MRKNSISLSVEENTTQERRHLRKDVPQMLKQQIPNHQLHKFSHKMNPSLNSSHKMNPSLNSHKAHPPVNNNHKAKHPLVLYRNLFHLNSATMMKRFQMHGPWPEFTTPARKLTHNTKFKHFLDAERHKFQEHHNSSLPWARELPKSDPKRHEYWEHHNSSSPWARESPKSNPERHEFWQRHNSSLPWARESPKSNPERHKF